MSNDNGDKLKEDKTPSEVVKDRLTVIEARIKELEPQKELNKKELTDLYNEKIKLTINPAQPAEPPKDFKIAEIWVKEGQLILDASPEFWIDKLRAIGVLEFCKKIVYDYNPPPEKVSIVDKGGFKKFVNGIKKRF